MALSWDEIRKNAKRFSIQWENAVSEEAEKQPFLMDFLAVFGVDYKEIKNKGEGSFEYRVPQEIGLILFLAMN